MGYVAGGAVIPHGALILDPRNFNGSENATDAANALHYAALDAGHFIKSLEPDVIVLMTPHGLSLPKPFLFYLNPKAEGSVSVDDWLPCSYEPCAFNASAAIDTHLTRTLASELSKGHDVTTLSGFGPPAEGTLPLPLGWAEVIPLYFMNRAYTDDPLSRPGAALLAAELSRISSATRPRGQGPRLRRRRMRQRRHLTVAPQRRDPDPEGINANRRTEHTVGSSRSSSSTTTSRGAAAGSGSLRPRNAAPPPVVVLSMPSRRYEHSVSMVPELLSLGTALFDLLDQLDERVVVVVSGDLAHTWDAAGPYGFSEHAARFDAAAVQWARDLDRDALLKTAAKNVGDAKSCGFPGMVVLQGVIDKVKPDNMHSVLLEYGHPSYYGMMCAVFDFQGDA